MHWCSTCTMCGRAQCHNCQHAGNGGCTLITAGFAMRLGLVDASGWPKQARVRTVW